MLFDYKRYCLSFSFREKMVGANLHENNIEGAFELWFERTYPSRCQRRFHRYQGKQYKE
ncbi:MAG: hypothetical protein K0S47_2086 [Herbinix sp.]|jgi:hypothetical protein|nr:hypothetical protein [Herbinix sp.]